MGQIGPMDLSLLTPQLYSGKIEIKQPGVRSLGRLLFGFKCFLFRIPMECPDRNALLVVA